MSQVTHQPFEKILVVGAGLIGTSLAMAIQSANNETVIDAVEISCQYRETLQPMGVFRRIYRDTQEVDTHYDLVVLATPPHTAQALLAWAVETGQWVMDVGSVKTPIEAARSQMASEVQPRVILSHPMAGKAHGGPQHADAELFNQRTWLFLETSSPPDCLIGLVKTCGASVQYVANGETHDQLMSFVSHGIHVSSLCAMLSSDEGTARFGNDIVNVSGPAFWDITRLAASPAEFWTDTLLSNQEHVAQYIARMKKHLSSFENAILQGDKEALSHLLNQAKQARSRWENMRGHSL